jgi:hypothetical protein
MQHIHSPTGKAARRKGDRFHRAFAFFLLFAVWAAALGSAAWTYRQGQEEDKASAAEFAKAERKARQAGYCVITANPDGTSTLVSYDADGQPKQMAENTK